MRSPYDFIIKPKGQRYNNTKKVGDKELIVNTEISNYKFINKTGIVVACPALNKTSIKEGDEVAIHHNVFRRWYNIRKQEKNSRSYLNENEFLVQPDQIFAYKSEDQWKSLKGFCFVQPIQEVDRFEDLVEKKNVGVIVYSDGFCKEDEIVGFHPGSEYEFVIDGKLLYRVKSNLITMKYGYKTNEKTYNPSWAQSS